MNLQATQEAETERSKTVEAEHKASKALEQAAAAEHAAALGLDYAHALLDLVKAFDRIPHWLLIREALRLGNPIWLLRLDATGQSGLF